MLDLPKSTYVGKIIAKDKIYSHSGADSALKDLFVKQVERRLIDNKGGWTLALVALKAWLENGVDTLGNALYMGEE